MFVWTMFSSIGSLMRLCSFVTVSFFAEHSHPSLDPNHQIRLRGRLHHPLMALKPAMRLSKKILLSCYLSLSLSPSLPSLPPSLALSLPKQCRSGSEGIQRSRVDSKSFKLFKLLVAWGGGAMGDRRPMRLCKRAGHHLQS